MTRALRTDWKKGEKGHDFEHNEISERLRSARDFGVKANGVADDTAALQAAIDAVSAVGGVLQLPPGRIELSAPLMLSGKAVVLRGAGRDTTHLRNRASDMFASSSVQTWWRFKDMSLRADAGHVWALHGAAQCHFRHLDVWCYDAGKSIWHQDASAGGGRTCLENVFELSRLTITPDHTVPAFSLVGSGNINCNTFRNLRCTYSGNYFFHLESTTSQSWLYDNSFRDINFEVTNGGTFRLLSCQNTVIENCHESDLHAQGEITKDLITLGKSAAGPQTWHTAIRSCGRRGGVLAEGVSDIYVGEARHTTIETCSIVPISKARLTIDPAASATTHIHNSAAFASTP
jgi:hypothetical protein